DHQAQAIHEDLTMTTDDTKGSKLYRFAFYGATASGKTVLLAALAKHQPLFASNCYCNTVPLGPPPKQPSKEQAARYQALKAGKEHLDKALDALQQGSLPAPTPTDHVDMSFEFDFHDGERTYRIELIDYSGESLDPNLSVDERTNRLLQQIKDKDALLVLAPMPSNRTDIKDTDEEYLRGLQESFSLLQEGKKKNPIPMPIAMLASKWDRFSKLDEPDQEKARAAFREFLDRQPPPPHSGLLSALRGGSVDPHRNFSIFPVSALGICDSDGRPQRFAPLHSFGLAEPFVWLARRHDELELDHYTAQIDQLHLREDWKAWIQWPKLIKLGQLSRRGEQMARALPPSDPLKAEFTKLQKRVKKANHQALTVSTVALAGTLVAVNLGLTSWRYQSIKNFIQDPQATAQQVQEAEHWLKAYTESVLLSHPLSQWLILSRDQAERQLSELRSGRDDIYWFHVTNAAPEQQIKEAENYLSAFPNGRHRTEAIALIAKLADRLDWESFVLRYQSALQEGKTVEAGAMLVQRSDDPRLTELIGTFESTALEALERNIQKALQRDDIDLANDILAQAKQWPAKLRTTQGIEQERRLKRQVDLAQDRDLYSEVREYQNLDDLSQYLNLVPRGRMYKEVQAYFEWLNAQTQPMPLTLSVNSIQWDDKSGTNSGLQLTVWVDGKKAIQIPNLKSRSGKKDNIQSASSASYAFTNRLDQEIDIKIELQDTDNWFGSGHLGSGSRRTQVKGVNGLRIAATGEKLNNIVFFGLSGLPQAPALPLWREE
ncbi:MAG: hypothetical protein VBE63_01680, partial [Lamprobacter sp.]|uniref:hypothetical protein n=1 Tax=Lamprobacter sp. TaxID=3100796 RepID=UPI002B25CE44